LDLKSLIIVLFIFTCIALILPGINAGIMGGNATLKASEAFPLLKLTPYFIGIAGIIMALYWGYGRMKK